jgi:hypothetical protein
VVARVLEIDGLEFLQKLALTRREIDRVSTTTWHKRSPCAYGADAFDAFAAQAENFPALGSEGILILAEPSSVGISMSPPSAAVVNDIGISQCRSL